MEKRKNIKKVIAIVLSMMIAMAVISALFGGGFLKRTRQTLQEKETCERGGMIVKTADVKGMSLLINKIETKSFNSEIATNDEDTYSVTATITPENAENKNVDWSLAFKNPNVITQTAWANGKTVEDFVTVTPEYDGSLTAILKNIEPFGEQIILTVASREDSSIMASCNLDYKQKIRDYKVNIFGKDVSNNGACYLTADFSTDGNYSILQDVSTIDSIYTIENNDDKIKTIEFTIANLFESNINKNVIISVSDSIKQYTESIGSVMLPLFNKTWAKSFGTGAVARNTLIDALSSFPAYVYMIICKDSTGVVRLSGGVGMDTSIIVNQKKVTGLSINPVSLAF